MSPILPKMGSLMFENWHIDIESQQIDRIWGIWGSYPHIPKAIFYLLKGDYIRRHVQGIHHTDFVEIFGITL